VEEDKDNRSGGKGHRPGWGVLGGSSSSYLVAIWSEGGKGKQVNCSSGEEKLINSAVHEKRFLWVGGATSTPTQSFRRNEGARPCFGSERSTGKVDEQLGDEASLLKEGWDLSPVNDRSRRQKKYSPSRVGQPIEHCPGESHSVQRKKDNSR